MHVSFFLWIVAVVVAESVACIIWKIDRYQSFHVSSLLVVPINK